MAPEAAGQKDVLVLGTRAETVKFHYDFAEVYVAEHNKLRKVDKVDFLLLLHFLRERRGKDFDQAVDVFAGQIKQGFDFS